MRAPTRGGGRKQARSRAPSRPPPVWAPAQPWAQAAARSTHRQPGALFLSTEACWHHSGKRRLLVPSPKALAADGQTGQGPRANLEGRWCPPDAATGHQALGGKMHGHTAPGGGSSPGVGGCENSRLPPAPPPPHEALGTCRPHPPPRGTGYTGYRIRAGPVLSTHTCTASAGRRHVRARGPLPRAEPRPRRQNDPGGRSESAREGQEHPTLRPRR